MSAITQLAKLLGDKSKKAKEKVATIAAWLNDNSLPVTDLIAVAEKSDEQEKANCIEAMESVTRKNPAIANEKVLTFVTKSLKDPSPRVKWESARVIGNIASQFPAKLKNSITFLLDNADHEGTVVRWATALALGEIVKLQTKFNTDLLPALEAICEREENQGVKKKYVDAIKKVKRKK
ncbi:MAG TPA: HEAT repeat domain-containing protein [Cyclobacteriaceae bacterium]|nr:HEAT repeat domain-containing protein [Cyclobacteriaceae bacterium]HMV09010.1 HEAT repeat domain-containing protein [Cyclobacteriaceae bacterium]HMV88674.1 HEAT repeat domain-containing protein [Cyclobacteriaceae bacterium]HMW99585.1 HEAT repeat domain-containing protein [Cyclobacteriaceae bacterium]HMX51632.1 HEAT repeat domain-containing protein [Cyclobacteriaceae bacterium]